MNDFLDRVVASCMRSAPVARPTASAGFNIFEDRPSVFVGEPSAAASLQEVEASAAAPRPAASLRAAPQRAVPSAQTAAEQPQASPISQSNSDLGAENALASVQAAPLSEMAATPERLAEPTAPAPAHLFGASANASKSELSLAANQSEPSPSQTSGRGALVKEQRAGGFAIHERARAEAAPPARSRVPLREAGAQEEEAMATTTAVPATSPRLLHTVAPLTHANTSSTEAGRPPPASESGPPPATATARPLPSRHDASPSAAPAVPSGVGTPVPIHVSIGRIVVRAPAKASLPARTPTSQMPAPAQVRSAVRLNDYLASWGQKR